MHRVGEPLPVLCAGIDEKMLGADPSWGGSLHTLAGVCRRTRDPRNPVEKLAIGGNDGNGSDVGRARGTWIWPASRASLEALAGARRVVTDVRSALARGRVCARRRG